MAGGRVLWTRPGRNTSLPLMFCWLGKLAMSVGKPYGHCELGNVPAVCPRGRGNDKHEHLAISAMRRLPLVFFWTFIVLKFCSLLAPPCIVLQLLEL